MKCSVTPELPGLELPANIAAGCSPHLRLVTLVVVGKDGAIGVALSMGGATTTNRAIVQSMSRECYEIVRKETGRLFPAHSDVAPDSTQRGASETRSSGE
jgi:hypothetical protein